MLCSAWWMPDNCKCCKSFNRRTNGLQSGPINSQENHYLFWKGLHWNIVKILTEILAICEYFNEFHKACTDFVVLNTKLEFINKLDEGIKKHYNYTFIKPFNLSDINALLWTQKSAMIYAPEKVKKKLKLIKKPIFLYFLVTNTFTKNNNLDVFVVLTFLLLQE